MSQRKSRPASAPRVQAATRANVGNRFQETGSPPGSDLALQLRGWGWVGNAGQWPSTCRSRGRAGLSVVNLSPTGSQAKLRR